MAIANAMANDHAVDTATIGHETRDATAAAVLAVAASAVEGAASVEAVANTSVSRTVALGAGASHGFIARGSQARARALGAPWAPAA